MRGLSRATAILAAAAFALWADELAVRTHFTVRHVGQGILYLDGGSRDGLAEGMRLRIFSTPDGAPAASKREVGEAVVLATTTVSASCEMKSGSLAEIRAGDEAELGAAEAESIKILRTSKSRRRYAQVVSFTEGDPIEAELREYVPRPPLPEINRVRGQFAFEHNGFIDRAGSSVRTTQEGVVMRADMTRIGGTFWNFTGYWRGRLMSTSRDTSGATLNDLLSRTYHIGFYYNNPTGRYTAGIGRLLIPWATSLSTIDGVYAARRVNRTVTAGAFAGSMPDPTAWNFDPQRRILGTFVAVERGSYDSVRYTGTAGAATSRRGWRPERNFLFFENTVYANSKVSIFHNLEADQLARALVSDARPKPRLARSFLTVRLTASRNLTFDINHNYFRGVPTFDDRLVATGLLDKLLFQGWSGGFRYDFGRTAAIYANAGANRREDDRKTALNYMGGLLLKRIPAVPFRVDLRWSRFNSSFASGRYESVSLSRELTDRIRVELLMGQQDLSSTVSRQNRTRYANFLLDYMIGTHYVLGGGFTTYRGQVQNYDQYFLNVGYRF